MDEKLIFGREPVDVDVDFVSFGYALMLKEHVS